MATAMRAGNGWTALKQRAGRIAREARITAEITRSRGSPRVMFFPCSSREGASLLRAYRIAEALHDMGWAAVVVPKQLSQPQRRRLLNGFRPDAVVVQTGRHPLNRVEHLDGVPFVYDIDDADCLHPQAHTREEALARAANGVMAGSRFIAEWYGHFNPLVETIWTGGPVRLGDRPGHAARPPILTWAQSNPLAYRHEFEFVEHVALNVRKTRPALKLRLYGWRWAADDPRLEPLRAGGVDLQLMAPMPYDRFVASLEECAVGLSPIMVESDFSRGKSFGKILAYLDAKVPVICSEEVDHTEFFESGSGVVSNDPDVWIAETGRLLDAADQRDTMADAAFTAYCSQLSTEAAAFKVNAFLRRAFNL